MILKFNTPTIRDTLNLNIKQALSFNKILLKSDIPYDFNQIKKYWWRWYSEIYGFYYNRVKRTYCIWLTTFLKKNLDIKIPFFFLIPRKNNKPLDSYKNYIFLYNISLNYNNKNKINYINLFFNLTFEYTKFIFLSEASRFILYPKNKKHRPLGSFGVFNWELDMFFSSYNAKWNDLYNKNSYYSKCNHMSKSFLIIMNSFFINTGFFINSYDSILNIYPNYYLDYYNNLIDKKLLNFFNLFMFSYNINFFINIINLISNLFNYIFFYFFNFKFNNIINNNLLLYNSINYYYLSKFISFKHYYIKYFISIINLIKRNIISKNYLVLNKSKLLLILNNNLDLKNSIKINKINYYLKLCNNINLIYFYNKLNSKINNKKYYILQILNSLNLLNINNLKQIKNNLINSKIIFKLFFKSMLINLIKLKQIKNLLSLLEKKKLIKKYYYNIFLLKPSTTIIKTALITKIKWRTRYKKYFVNIYNLQNILKVKKGNFYQITTKSSKIAWYLIFDEQYSLKLKLFLITVNNLIMSMFKFNFNYYVNIKFNTNVTEFFLFNLKYQIISNFFYLLRYVQYFKLNKLLINFNSLLYIEKNFIYILNFFNFCIINKNNYLTNTKIKKNKLSYLKLNYIN